MQVDARTSRSVKCVFFFAERADVLRIEGKRELSRVTIAGAPLRVVVCRPRNDDFQTKNKTKTPNHRDTRFLIVAPLPRAANKVVFIFGLRIH